MKNYKLKSIIHKILIRPRYDFSCIYNFYFSELVSSTTSALNDYDRWYFRLKESSKLSKFKSKWIIRESLSTISDRWSNEVICNLLYSSTVLMFYQVIYDAKIAGLFTISLVYAIISIFIFIRDRIKLSTRFIENLLFSLTTLFLRRASQKCFDKYLYS